VTGPGSVVERDGRIWLPDNRWDLVAGRVGTAPPRRVAVVVPYFEQPASLSRMYAGLASLDPQQHQLVVTDDGSARSPAAPPPPGYPLQVTLVRQEDRGCRPGAARNLAVAATDAEIIVCLDADTVPAVGTVERLAAWPGLIPDALVVGRRGHVDLTGWSPADAVAWLAGRRPAPPARPDPAWLDDGYRRTRDLLDADDRSYRYVISAVMSCSRLLWDDLGGFDGSRCEYGGDDWEFAYRAFNNGAVLVHDPAAVAWHDEPDWSDRDGGSKDLETLWLAEVIPEPLTRGTGIRQAWPDTLVTIDVEGVPAGPVVATIGDVVAALPDVLVHARGTLAPPAAAHLAHDPRVVTAPPSCWQRRRARRAIALHGPQRWTVDGLRRVVQLASPTVAGVVRVLADDGAVLATVTSTRAAGRRRRAAALGVTLPDGLCGTRTVAATDVGAAPIDDVDLAALFARW
jgi:GT2 family glycosyltransferase